MLPTCRWSWSSDKVKEKSAGEKARKKRKIVRRRGRFLENSSEKEREVWSISRESFDDRRGHEERRKNRVKDRNVRTYVHRARRKHVRRELSGASFGESPLSVNHCATRDAHDLRDRRNFRTPFHVVTLTPCVRQAAKFKGTRVRHSCRIKLTEESLLRCSERKDNPFDSPLGRDMSSRLTFTLCQVMRKSL